MHEVSFASIQKVKDGIKDIAEVFKYRSVPKNRRVFIQYCNRIRMGVGGNDVTTQHRRAEVHDTDGPRRTTMVNDAHGLLGTTHAMAPTTLRIRLHDYV